jgi:hypothetical protein
VVNSDYSADDSNGRFHLPPPGTPADAYFGRHTAIIERREKIKKLTIQNRRLIHQRQAA